MEHIETEVKFFITDPVVLREKLISLGAISGGNTFETNIRFEDKDKNLIKNKSLLRLRKDSKTILTFKSQPPYTDSRFKMLRELEIEVSDFSTAIRILESLGFIQEQIYEKWRETLVLGSIYFCIDKMPYGDFLEIEGTKEEITEYASLLGLEWEERILLNYLELFDILKKSLNLSFSDITFENFKNVRADFSKYFYIIKAELKNLKSVRI
ncbi:MAG: class IV adenylate cyclase [Desulfobacterales bacterium]